MRLDVKHTNVFSRSFSALNDDNIRFLILQGGSRCHSKDTKIRMYDGKLKNVQDIVIGDKIASYNGLGYNIVDETHSGITDMYMINQGKGISYSVTSDHILCVRQNSPKTYKIMTNEKNPYGYGHKAKVMYDKPYDKNEIIYFTAEEYSKFSGRKKRLYSGFKNTFLELEKKENKIDPYYLGLWLGDGHSNQGYTITNIDKEIVEYLYEFSLKNDLEIKKKGITYELRNKTFNTQSDFSKLFYEYNLIRNKHIPDDYIYTCYDDRLKLIAGLIDTDGGNTKRNTLYITQKNKKIIEGLKEILDISGFYTRGIKEHIAKMKRKDGYIYECLVYHIEFNHKDFNDLNKYIKVERKKVYKDDSKIYDMFNTKIESKYIGKGEYYGFSLKGDDKLYKLEDGTITHNSSKTYSLCQLMVVECLTKPNTVISIVRKTFPTLRRTVMRDFFEILNTLNIYDVNKHNKSEFIYKFDNGSFVEFFAADDEQKLRGSKRDILWVNEANELNFEEFTQLNLRTTNKLIFDFNPSENFHWLYELVSRKESILIHSTYKDNPFLSQNQVKEIEALINYDESYYRIYALGEKGTGKTTIFTSWKYYHDDPIDYNEKIYGLDFGYNHSTALVECIFTNDATYVKELLYKNNLTSSDLLKELERLNIQKNIKIVCDPARPEIIEDLKRRKHNTQNAIKNVADGIDSVKTTNLFIKKDSINLVKEISSYKWKTNGDIVLNEPVKVYDDLMDAMRYAIHYHKLTSRRGKYTIM